ncbi:MAG TPA: response regulator transcription factor [Chloroflexia bacterium]|nr:response regulator transcription factor [Chloroflexia bacterium]
MSPITIVHAEDQSLVLDGIVRLLEDDPGLKIVGKAYSGEEALALCFTLSPQLLILDLMLPDVTGVYVVQKLRQAQQPVKIVVLSSSDSPAQIEHCLKKGADGYVVKNSSIQTLREAIYTVTTGGIFVDPALKTGMESLASIQAPLSTDAAIQLAGSVKEDFGLTTKELEVLRVLASSTGRSSDIAARLSISKHTANNHINSILSKTGATSRMEVIQLAKKNGLIEL